MLDNVAIIILNYKTWKDTLNEIKMVHEICNVNYQNIIVIDNDSQNESGKKLREYSDLGYVFIQSKKNKGYAAGNNIGLRYAYNKKYKYAWILNNDILFDDSSILGTMINVLQKDSKLAVVNTDVYAPDGHMFNRDSKRPSFFDLTFGILKYRKKGRKIENMGGYGYIYRPQGCSMLVDLEKMKEVGFMDEYTFLYSEEIILAERLLRKGYYCGCCFEKKVIHNHSKTVKSVLNKKKIRKMQNASFRYYLQAYRDYSKFQVLICIMFNTIKLIALN